MIAAQIVTVAAIALLAVVLVPILLLNIEIRNGLEADE